MNEFINVPTHLFKNLMEDAIECLNHELTTYPHRANGPIATQYREEIAECKEVLKHNE